MKIRLALLLFLTGCSAQIATVRDAVLPTHPIYGQDPLALELPAFNSKELSAVNPKGGVFTQLDNTFGGAIDAATYVLQHNQPKYFEAKIINGSCHSDHNCGSYEFLASSSMAEVCAAATNPTFAKQFKARVSLYRALSGSFNSTTFIISPINEHGCSETQYRAYADLVRSVWAGVQLANSPLGSISVESYLGAWIERHGNKNISGADIVSLDGVDATQIDFQSFLKNTAKAKLVEVWGSPYNCRLNGNFVDPRKRTVCAPNQLLNLYAHITDPVPAPVAFTGKECKKILPFVAPSIWKPSADYAPKDNRSFLPVLITAKLAPSAPIKVLASNGGMVGTLGYYATYLNQGWRWYEGGVGGSSQGGYALQKAALAATGSPDVWLEDKNGTCMGPLVSGQRQGLFD